MLLAEAVSGMLVKFRTEIDEYIQTIYLKTKKEGLWVIQMLD